ncbi:MAG TPA: TlpA disulfide reductase family protein [Caulobacteraceae bacterium]|nr:TlpA disulfide reductase family protein [Caulobacteraceae bacterium]
MAAALYVIPGCTAKPGGDLASLARGQMKRLAVDAKPAPAPTVTFTDAAGHPHTLAEFKGKAVVLNIWATWCAPCVEEMPTLAKLSAATAGQPVAVVPVSVDRDDDKANAEAFIAKRPPLPFYGDPSYALAFALKPANGDFNLPMTVLIDASGNVRGHLAGGADWSGDDARKVVAALEKGP